MTDDEAMPLAERAAGASYRAAPVDDGLRAEGLGPLHRALRGRYRWAVGLGLTFAAAGIAAAVTLPKRVYKSAGYIDIAPKVPKVVWATEEHAELPMYDNFMESQAALASSRRVVDMVMQTPAWAGLGRGSSDEAIVKFQQSLAVQRLNRTEFIEVAFSDENPEAAMVAVNEVIGAYMKIVDEQESKSGTSTLNLLTSQRDIINNHLNDLRASEASITQDIGREAFEARYQQAYGELNKLDAALQSVDLEIAAAKSAADAAAGEPQRPWTEKEIAAKDSAMAGLLADKEQVTAEIADLEANGLGPNHQDVLTAKKKLAAVERAVVARAEAFRKEAASRPAGASVDLAEKESRRAKIVDLRDKALEETKRLGKQKLQLASNDAEKVVYNEQLDDVKRRLAEIRVESAVHGRISIASTGERPVRPEYDKRVSYAVLALMGGMGLGFGLVLLYGLAKARLRHVSDVDADTSWGRFLGVVPEVPDPEADPVAHDAAAELSDHCVQHIRSMLQLRPCETSRVVAVTSPSPQAGKTTIGFALGLSFAAAGSRTLLVDCDFSGHGMTSAVRSMVAAARQAAAASESGADENHDGPFAAMLAARRTKAETDDAPETSGPSAAGAPGAEAGAVVKTPAVLARRRLAERSKLHSGAGVLDALEGVPLERCMVETGVDGLTVLPVGDARATDVDRLTPSAFRRLMTECRGRFDAVIIDTGPVLGSIEAVFATVAADDVVLVLPRGEKRSVAEQALERLRQVGARVAGVVFNRALFGDVAHSNYSSKSASVAAEAA